MEDKKNLQPFTMLNHKTEFKQQSHLSEVHKITLFEHDKLKLSCTKKLSINQAFK